jgi:hypothetical protein
MPDRLLARTVLQKGSVPHGIILIHPFQFFFQP